MSMHFLQGARVLFGTASQGISIELAMELTWCAMFRGSNVGSITYGLVMRLPFARDQFLAAAPVLLSARIHARRGNGNQKVKAG